MGGSENVTIGRLAQLIQNGDVKATGSRVNTVKACLHRAGTPATFDLDCLQTFCMNP